MIAASTFSTRTPDQVKAELFGYPPSCVAAALRFREHGGADALLEMLPGMIEFHLPAGTARPPAMLPDDLRLSEDLGLDSLALTEMAFVMSELFGISIETREVTGVQTVGDLKAFLIGKLQA